MTETGTPRGSEAGISSRLCLALDLEDEERAIALARACRAHFGVVKVGLELFASAGPGVVERLSAEGFSVFVDLKLHDIPTTVRRAAHRLGALGVAFATLHCAGGEAMLAAGAAGLAAGAADAGAPAPVALGVTVLTSALVAPPELLVERARLAEAAGCGGIVCGAPDLSVLTGVAPGLVRVVPGTRPSSAFHDDQARVRTPEEALADGAGLLVIGRIVTAASDPEAAAEALVASLAPPR